MENINEKEVDEEVNLENDFIEEEDLSLIKARIYRRWGGIMPFLMRTVTGVREFVEVELVKNNMPAQQFLDKLNEKFPDIPKEHMPKLTSIKMFRKKIIFHPFRRKED